MPGVFARAILLAAALVAAASANAQTRHRREPRETDKPAPPPPLSVDKRDSLVQAPGAFTGRPYWLALAQCGGLYFKLNTLYAADAVQARVVKPDPRATADYTRKLTEAIKTASVYFNGAERMLMTDRGIERSDAVLVYNGQSAAAGDRVKTIDAALAATNVCPALYQACQEAFPKACNETVAPTG